MKKTILIVCLFALHQSLFAIPEKTIKATVDKALVYTQGAVLYSKGLVNLVAGNNTIIFEGVAANPDLNSLQASGKGSFSILDIQYNTKYIESEVPVNLAPKLTIYKNQLEVVNDSILEISFQLSEVSSKTATLNLEKNVLLNNRLMKGETKKDSLNLLKESLVYLREKLFNIDAELLKLNRQESKINKITNRLNKRANDLQLLIDNGGAVTNNAPKQINQIIVTAWCDMPCQTTISVNYFVYSAGWLPRYELRATNNSNSLALKQYAELYQNTGIDWNDANITLSTGNPNTNNTMPILSPYWLAYLQIKNKYAEITKATKVGTIIAGSTNTTDDAALTQVYDSRKIPAEAEKLSEVKYTEAYVQMNQNILRTEYVISMKYQIPSDNKKHILLVQSHALDASFDFSAVPKLDRNAFLLAHVTGWEDLNLLDGKALLYLDESYIGQTILQASSEGDTLSMNMGRDQALTVERKLLKDKSKEKLLSTEKIITKSYQITVRNTKGIAINMNLYDQIPLSSDVNSKVVLTDAGNGNLEESTGQITWKINL